jgi:AraC-like DNA-binding protein
METLAKYWKIVRLESSGDIAPLPRPTALQHLQTEYSEFADQDPLNDRTLQTLLVQQLKQAQLAAALCLRCYASHYILISCQRLVNNYGEHYGLKLSDLAPAVLTDDGSLPIEITPHPDKLSIQRPKKYENKQGERFQPLALRILEKFNPEKASLGTWAARLTWQDQTIKKILKEEYGILLISDWALLNDTQPAAFQRILIKYFNFPDPAQPLPSAAYQSAAQQLLTLVATQQTYHDIYVAEHVPTRGKPCSEPTLEQCQRMMTQLGMVPGQPGSPDSPHDFRAEKLAALADYVRRHRLKQLPPPDQLLAASSATSSAIIIPQEFLRLFDRYLGLAVAQTLQTRLTAKRMKPQKAKNILKALHLQYRVGLTQTEIAQQLGFPRQDTVSKLLDFKAMATGIIAHMSDRLKNDTPLLADYFNDPDRLLTLLAQLEGYLELVLKKDAQWRQTASQHRKEPSQLSQVIGDFLDQYPHPD